MQSNLETLKDQIIDQFVELITNHPDRYRKRFPNASIENNICCIICDTKTNQEFWVTRGETTREFEIWKPIKFSSFSKGQMNKAIDAVEKWESNSGNLPEIVELNKLLDRMKKSLLPPKSFFEKIRNMWS